MKKTDSLFRRLAGSLPGVVLWLAVLPLAALGQANYATPYTFITLAGKAGLAGIADGTNRTARFSGPIGVAVDTNGNLYVGDGGNHTIRKVTPAGVVTTLAGLAGHPGSADGTNSAARFNGPSGVALDSAGNLYVAEYSSNATIRKVTLVGTNWVVTTLAGLAGHPGSADGTNSAARFNLPAWVVLDSVGNLYVTDQGNDTIRKVTPIGTNWVVTTLAGKVGVAGSADGTNSAARFFESCGVAVDTNGNVYVADSGNNTIRQITPLGTNWVVTTLAGKVGVAGSADGMGNAARFNWPSGVALDSAGILYVADQVNQTIRKLTPDGTNWAVTTLAGLAGSDGSADGTGSAARFHDPVGVAVDSAGNLYVTEYGNSTVRRGFPADSVPPPILQPPNLSAGQFGFGITGLPGLAVNIQHSVDLAHWGLVGTYILNGGTNYFVDRSPSQSVQFDRVQVR